MGIGERFPLFYFGNYPEQLGDEVHLAFMYLFLVNPMYYRKFFSYISHRLKRNQILLNSSGESLANLLEQLAYMD